MNYSIIDSFVTSSKNFIEIEKTIVALDEAGNSMLEMPVYVISSGNILRLERSILLEYFDSIEIDGVIVDLSQYTLEEGSTILIFGDSYLDTLTSGTHTVIMKSIEKGFRFKCRNHINRSGKGYSAGLFISY